MPGSAANEAHRSRSPVCPQCGYCDQVVPIAYGMPGQELIEQARRGEVALGGCSLAGDSPEWYCKGCLHKFVVQARHAAR